MTPGDRLLYAISAKRELGWASFKKTFELLCGQHLTKDDLQDMNFARYDTARGLDALGHVELDFGSTTRLYTAPPALALLPTSGLPEAILSGARSPNTIELLQAQVQKRGNTLQLDVRNQKEESQRFPARVAVTAETRDDLLSLAKEAGIAFQEEPASWKILNFAGSLSDYLAGIEWQRTDRLNWEEQQFNPQLLRFSTTPFDGEIQLIKYVHPSRQYPLHFLWRGVEAARVDPDWGRFAILSKAGRNVIHYERFAAILVLPATIQLPKLLARALCLCSGFVPRIISGSAVAGSPVNVPLFRLYVNVPPEFAQIVARKLDQMLITDFRLLEIEND